VYHDLLGAFLDATVHFWSARNTNQLNRPMVESVDPSFINA
jgi:hypothetical protein